jgi:hypothetical protein
MIAPILTRCESRIDFARLILSPYGVPPLSNGGPLFDSSIRAQSNAIITIERCSGEEVVKR